MSEIILESKLNYHSIDELSVFGNYVLSIIKSIRFSKNKTHNSIIDNAFVNSEYLYPERHFQGVRMRFMNNSPYYIFRRKYNGKEYFFHTKKALLMYGFAVRFASKYNLKLYKDNRKNNFKGTFKKQ